MARYFSSSKIIVDSISAAIQRRGYAAASQGVVRGVRSNVMMKKVGEDQSIKKTTSWVPDPVTGYYRPESHVKEIDAAELRNMLLKYKPKQN